MKRISIFLLTTVITLTAWAQGSSIVVPATTPGTDLAGPVSISQWYANGGTSLAYDDAAKGFPFTTDATGVVNHDGWQNSISCKTMFPVKTGNAYQLVLRMKADLFPRGQTITVVARDANDRNQKMEYAYNVSKAGVWEEVYIPIIPIKDGNWKIEYIFMGSTIRYATTPSTVYIDPDFDVYELPAGQEVISLKGIDVAVDKDIFESSTLRVDGLGNIYTKKENDVDWKHVFPKMMYKGYNGGYISSQHFVLFQRYKEYGFNGVMDIWTGTESQAVVDAGLDYVSIDASYSTGDKQQYHNQVNNWADTNNRHHNVIWYNYDNENASIAAYEYQQNLESYVDGNYLDPKTGKRRHPVYYLNGQFGLPRTYHNGDRNVMDITGSYVGSLGAVGDANYKAPAPTLLTEFMTPNQKAPVTVISLQSYLHEGFIPALFYGIIMGGKAMCVWRDGTTYGGSNPDFRLNVWAEAFKNDVSPKLDQMLPLLEQPHFTSWKASTNQFPSVRIGTRELNGTGYLILANFASEDLAVTVNLTGRQAKEAVDMFTGAHIANITNGSFQFTLGHYNNGYKVIRLLENPSSASGGINKTNLSVSAYPNPVTDSLRLEIGTYEPRNLSFQLFDNNGKLLKTQKIGNKVTYIQMKELAPATYLVKVIEEDRELKTLKIIKK